MTSAISLIQIQLSALAEKLIDACGGLVSAAHECDVSKTQLQRAADPNHAYTLKASTIYHLEQACGRPIMSRAIYELGNGKREITKKCPLFIGIDLSKSAADLTVCVRGTLADGFITVNERQVLNGKVAGALEILGTMQTVLNRFPAEDVPALCNAAVK